LVNTGKAANLPNRFEKTERAHARDVRSIFGNLIAHFNVAHGSQIIDFVRLGLRNNSGQHSALAKVPIMNLEPVENVVDSPGVSDAAPADDSVDVISFFEEQLCEVAAILPGYTCD
jgi:hypothetical protein